MKTKEIYKLGDINEPIKNSLFDMQIIGEITEYTLSNFLFNVGDKKEFSIFIYTGGGSVEVATAIKDYIEYHKINLTITCGGKCESAGTILLSAGIKKRAYKNCMFMFHQMTANDSKGNKINNEKEHVALNFYKKMYSKIYPTIELPQKSEDFKYLTAKEMFVEGLIDEIL